MMHPPILSRPLLVHLLAVAVLSPAAIAKTKKTEPKSQNKPAAAAPAGVKPNAKKDGPVATRSITARDAALNARKPAAAGRQTEGDRMPQGREDHRALIVPREALLSRVPTTGRLSEESCIMLAIANSPELQKRRAMIQKAVADRQAEKDWRNPELRLSYGSQNDDFVRNPYVERTIENLSETETFTSDQSTTSLANPGEFGFGEATTDHETGTNTTTRYREIERLVTPGRYSDTVVTNIYETRRDGSTSTRDRTVELNGFSQTRQDALAENVERTLRSTATETTSSSAENGNQETFSFVLRLQMPHPWMRRAKLARAAAEVTLAESQYLAEEDKLVRDVRSLFEDLAIRESTLRVHQKRRSNFAAFRTEMEGAPIADFAADAARASIDMADVLNDTSKTSSEANNIRAKIAILCGVADPRRIYSPGIVTRRIVDYSQLNEAYLVEMAMLYRADAVESRARLGIARALVDEAKAAKIPWATFIDAGYTRQWRDGYSGNEDEWMIRLGVELPIFDWVGINKRSREYQKASAEWEKQFELQRNLIQAQINAALVRVKLAYQEMRTFDTSVKSEQKAIQERLTKVEESARGLPGLAKNLRIKYDAEDATQILEIGRYRAYAEYNEALMNLEDVIGIRIEKVLSGEVTK